MTQTIETRYAPSQHTPGPWTLDDTKSFYVFASGEVLCNANRLANARLISAAPDLLVALEEVIAELDNREPPQGHIYRDTGGMILARDAIRKAKGE